MLHTLLLAASLPFALPSTSIEARVEAPRAQLAVTLALPGNASKERHGAVLILPGSGPSTRPGVQPFAEAFLRAGFAVLTFDKPGCGASSGSWLTSSLDDMAANGRTLVDWLRTRPEIDPSRIGLVGVSQGGWVAPLVASGRSDIAFAIFLTGGAVTPRAVETFDYERQLERSGAQGEDKEAARKAINAYFSYLSGQSPQSGVTDLLDSGKSQGWPEALGIGRVLPSEAQRPSWSWVATFDPLPSLRSLRIPVLALVGGLDRDPAADVKAWQSGLSENGDPRTEIRVVPSAGHVLTTGGTHVRGEFNLGALNAMAAWAASL